jgi:hypothetical protein
MSLKAELTVLDDEILLKVRRLGQPRIEFNAHYHQSTFYGVKSMAIKAGQSVELSISPVDSFGNAARIDGVPAWTVSDPSLVDLVVSPDGLSVRATSLGHVGVSVIGVSVDADLSEGIRTLAGSASLEIEAGEAVDLGVVVTPIVVAVAPLAPGETPVAGVPVEPVIEEAPVEPDAETPADVAPVAEEAPVTETPVEPVAETPDDEQPI